MRILFAGNPSIAVPALRELARAFPVSGVLTNADKPVGRHGLPEAPPVKREALALGLPVIQAEKLDRRARDQVAALQADLLVSFATGHYFGPKFLALFPLGAINIHPSLLPAWRGSAPIQFSILSGEGETGISIQRITEKIDGGNVLARHAIVLDGTETAQGLAETVAPLAAALIVRTLGAMESGEIIEEAQDENRATYSRMLKKEDGLIDWNRSARDIHCKVRAYYPWPKAWTTFDGTQLIIAGVHGPLHDMPAACVSHGLVGGTVVSLVKGKGLAITCADGLLYVSRLQLAQKKEMDASAFVNGNPGIIGSVLGT